MSTNKENSKEEKILLSYGRYTKSMESLRHYDSIQSANEKKVSKVNWYAVAAAGFLFSITKNPTLTSVVCIAIGIVDIMYLTACFITSLINVERYYISFFYELVKIEEKEKWIPPIYHYMFVKEEEDTTNNKTFVHHGTSYLKAIYYLIHLSIPFIVLVFAPSYILLRKSSFYQTLLNVFTGDFLIQNRFLVTIIYSVICILIYLVYSYFLLKIIGPMKTWLEKIYKKERKDV